jgi:hypothetical protein
MCPRVTLQLPAAKATLPWDAAHIESLDLSATLSEDDQRRTVGTRLTAMNISMAAMPIASLRRKLRQVGEGLPTRRTMYFATVAWPTSMPSFKSSP